MKNLTGRHGRSSLSGDGAPLPALPPLGPVPPGTSPPLHALMEATSNFGEPGAWPRAAVCAKRRRLVRQARTLVEPRGPVIPFVTIPFIMPSPLISLFEASTIQLLIPQPTRKFLA